MKRNLINPCCLIFVLVPLVVLAVVVEYATFINTDAVLNRERKLDADIDEPTMQNTEEESSPYHAKDDTIGNLRKKNLKLDGSGGTGAVGTAGATVAKKEKDTIASEERLARLQQLQQEVMELEDGLGATQPQENGTGSSAPLSEIIQNPKKLLEEESNSQMQNGIIDEPHGTKTAEPDSTGAMQHLLRLGEALGTSTAVASPGINTSANTSTAATSIATTNTSGDGEEEPGFAACMIIMDDTLRLYEWLAYHYTVLPLTSLVIGLDPKSTNDSVTEIYSMAERWSRFGLNITIWPLPDLTGGNNYGRMQMTFVQKCTQHFLDKKRERWLLHTDSDEFLSYNYFVPGAENITHFSKKSIFAGRTAPSVEKRASDRRAALPIRTTIPDFHRSGATILSFIKAQQANSSQDYFPTKNGCTRIVGLTYSIKTTNATQDNLLMTQKYQYHKKPSDSHSKVFLDLSKVESWHLEHGKLQKRKTIHNPFPKLCGMNGRYDSGQDFMGSVLRMNHYVGSLESWLERGGGNGTRWDDQNEATWRKKDSREPDYEGLPDVGAGDWVNSFVTKVGTQYAEELLFRPLAERTAFVRSKVHL